MKVIRAMIEGIVHLIGQLILVYRHEISNVLVDISDTFRYESRNRSIAVFHLLHEYLEENILLSHHLFHAERYSVVILLLHECGKLLDRKSTRLNSSHVRISYAVF